MLGGIQLGLVISIVEIWEARRHRCVDMRLLASQAQIISAGKLRVLVFIRIRLVIEQGKGSAPFFGRRLCVVGKARWNGNMRMVIIFEMVVVRVLRNFLVVVEPVIMMIRSTFMAVH